MQKISLQSSHLSIPDETKQALEAALKASSKNIGELLGDYPGTWGDPVLRERIDAMTPKWDGDVLVTGSATQGLNLALNTVGESQTIAINVPAYFGVLRIAKELKLDVKTWETVDELEAIGDTDAVLVTSNFTPPTGQSFSVEDKSRIAEFAKSKEAWVIEDNAYDAVWHDEFPDPIPSDPSKSIRISSLSKIASPALRLGFIKASPEAMKSIRSKKITMDLSSSVIPQVIGRDALTESVLQNFRHEMKGRVEVLRTALTDATGIDIPEPDGGPFVCLNLPENIDAKVLQEKLGMMGLIVDTNAHYYPDGENRPYLRLNAGAATQEELSMAATRITTSMNVLRLEAQPVSNAFRKGAAATSSTLAGKTVLVTGGRTKENIDGVRHFANHEREEGQGHQLAAELAAQGANVILVTAKTRIPPPDGVFVISHTLDGNIIHGTGDLVTAVSEVTGFADIDASISMAITPSVQFANQSEHKMKVKSDPNAPVTFDVKENTSLVSALTDVLANKASTVLGYDQYQNWVVGEAGQYEGDIAALFQELKDKPVPSAPKEEIAVEPYATSPLAGRKVIITSGHTHEKVTPTGDIVTNFASGRQGHAVAQSLVNMGAEVVLVTGPTLMADPAGDNVKTVHIKTAEELQKTCVDALPADAAICICAVGDFKAQHSQKLTFDEEGVGQLIMAQNPDTLKTLGLHETDRPSVVIGFAAETRDLVKYATGKLEKKGADAICANQVGSAILGRGHGRNAIQFVTAGGVDVWQEMPKSEVGFQIGRQINMILGEKIAAYLAEEIESQPATSGYVGDFVLTQGLQSSFAASSLSLAAVLIPLVIDENGISVLVTKRADHMRTHPGEWSFPGGKVDGTDRDRPHTALREAEEEIGLPQDRVSVIGQLPNYHVRTGFNMTPVLGVVRGDVDYSLNENEVSAIMKVPLQHFFDPDNCSVVSKDFKGQPIKLYSFEYGGEEISGATAGLLVNLKNSLLKDQVLTSHRLLGLYHS